MMPTTRITTQQCISHTAPTLTVLVKNYTPCQGAVWSQSRFPGTFYVPLGFYVVWIGKVCFLLPVHFCKAVDFTLATQTLSYNISLNTALISIIFANSNC